MIFKYLQKSIEKQIVPSINFATICGLSGYIVAAARTAHDRKILDFPEELVFASILEEVR